jgi:hypothetical protein
MRLARVLLAVALVLHLCGVAVRAADDEPDPFEGDGVSGRGKRLRQIDDQVQREAAPNWEEPDPLDEEHDDFDDPDEPDDGDGDGEPADPYDDGEREDEPQPVDLDETPARRPKGPLDRSPLADGPTGGTSKGAAKDDADD